jgi:hypothetical protein
MHHILLEVTREMAVANSTFLPSFQETSYTNTNQSLPLHKLHSHLINNFYKTNLTVFKKTPILTYFL